MNLEIARNMMVENQLRPNRIRDKNILKLLFEIKKETFLEKEFENLAYSDLDINIINNRGYLKNLHIAQLIQSAEILKNENVLHIGALTGYVTCILSKLAKKVIALEFEEQLMIKLNDNIKKLKLQNVEIITKNFIDGCVEKSPYDLIFIDCPQYTISDRIINQLKPEVGRIIMIKKINNEISKCVRITKNNQYSNEEILFDVFSKFTLYEKKDEFIF